MRGRAETEELLSLGLQSLGLEFSSDDLNKLLRFVELMRRWGRVYNLTAINEPESIIRLHLLDSLSIWPHLRSGRILDVGTGAGLPGIPLSVLFPLDQFELLDCSAKKMRFVRQAAIELGLANVRTVQHRIEDYTPLQPFDSIIVRAFGSLADIWSRTRGLLNQQGIILAMKGRGTELDLGSLRGADVRVIRLAVPGLEAERHVVELTPRQ